MEYVMIFNKKLISLAIISSLSLAGCGGGGNDEKQETPTDAGGAIITVRYIDSAVTGLNYQCDQTEDGKTNNNGEFTTVNNAQCNFFINDLNIGSAIIKKSQINQNGIVIIDPISMTKQQNVRYENIAVLLQSLDNDGNSENGINLENANIKAPLSTKDHNLLTMSASELQKQLQTLVKNPKTIVTEQQALAHLHQSLTTSGALAGYHSPQVQEIVTDINKLSTSTPEEMQQINFVDKVQQYQDILDSGASDNADIEVLKAVLTIAKIVNEPEVKERISFNYENTNLANETEDLLPQVLDSLLKANGPLLVPNELEKGSTDSEAKILYSLAQNLMTASNTLGQSFTNINRVASYDTEGKIQLNYQQAQSLRVIALSIANSLSTAAAYDLGSDKYFIPQRERVTIPLTIAQDYFTVVGEKKTTVNSEFATAEEDPVSLITDQSFMTLRNSGPEYLRTALSALKQAASIAATQINLDDKEFSNLTGADKQNLKAMIDSLNHHLQSSDGQKNPFTYTVLDQNGKVDGELTINLQEFYQNPITRNDITITENKYNCTIDKNLSKYMNQPMCYEKGDTNFWYGYEDLSSNKMLFVSGQPAKHLFSSDYTNTNIILSCREKDSNNNWVFCEK
ncbi:TPA: hypothetical protein ACX6QE_002034 [Photobacterium damselae]